MLLLLEPERAIPRFVFTILRVNVLDQLLSRTLIGLEAVLLLRGDGHVLALPRSDIFPASRVSRRQLFHELLR